MPSAALLLLPLMMHGIRGAAADLPSSHPRHYLHNERSNRGIAYSSWSPRGCLYEGQWHASGHEVVARSACLRCACAAGVLTCSRRACQPLPDAPPPKCHLLHKKGRCCPEIHCPNEIIISEQMASSRLDDSPATISSTSFNHACVEGGTVYAAGSAMESPVACEQCFCLRGVRRCVRPRCLPPPPHCSPRPTAGLCCPQRYYCQHDTTARPDAHHENDCMVEGARIPEGERVPQWERSRNCSQCFCLKGAVRCQELSCAPPLQGCEPLLRAGECCAHQYRCHHHNTDNEDESKVDRILVTMLTRNDLLPTDIQDRSFHSESTQKQETTDSVTTTDITDKETTATSETTEATLNKTKRKTPENVPITRGQILEEIAPLTDPPTTQTLKNTDTTDVTTTVEEMDSPPTTTTQTIQESDRTSPDLSEGTVKIMINGTINCSTEFSSSSIPVNDTKRILNESIPRVPYVERLSEDHTFNPNDIITDRSVNGGFDETETFTINVTSSLRTNTSQSPVGSSMTEVSKPGKVTDLKLSHNTSKQSKEGYDYDYVEPTLPPSLPNLKIIPFVAADAVVDDDEITSKVTYPILDRVDKFPVYYPKEKPATPFATRREDVYHPSSYPTFTSESVIPEHELPLTHEITESKNDELESVKKYLYSVSLNSPRLTKPITKSPAVTFAVEKPAVNMFSPPVETEGGFVPKDPSINDDYLSVYISTPAPPLVPHLTTSMVLDTGSEGCTSSDGRDVASGEYVSVGCSECVCVWGEMHCSPATGEEPCCGDQLCLLNNKNETVTMTTSQPPKKNVTENDDADPSDNSTPFEDQTEILEIETETELDNDSSGENLEAVSSGEDKMNSSSSTTATPTTVNVTVSSTVMSTTPPLIDFRRKETSPLPPPTTPVPDYEEDEEDTGFLGNVLKLLLSESFDVNKSANKKATTTEPPIPKTTFSTTTTRVYSRPPPSPKFPVTIPTRVPASPYSPHGVPTRLPPQKPTVVPFVPLPRRPVRLPERFTDNSVSHLYPLRPPLSVNRIDHLVLGEATAIHLTTDRPLSTEKPVTTSLKSTTEARPETTQKPFITTRPPEITTRAQFEETERPMINEVRPSVESSGGGLSLGGLLRLAGCNIYGRMYKVGGRIAELSTPCQECSCTELGIQCKPVTC